VIGLLSFRNLTLRPWRSLFLLLGYGLGVAVMIVLLSVGEALLVQARNERLVGGGELTVLPEGIDIEVLKTGGLGGMFFSIDHARFVYRQLLAAPRLKREIRAVAPQIEGKLLYLRTADGREIAVRGNGEIPSRSHAVGAGPDLASGAWEDDPLDRRWRDPTPAELRDEIDRFHLPARSAKGDPSWAEWQYYNVLSADRRRWAFITFMVGGAIPDGEWGGQILVTMHEQGRPARRFVANVPPTAVRFSTSDADLTMGQSSVRVRPDGDYALEARAFEEGTGTPLTLRLTVHPSPGAYFPGAALSGGEFVSGYAVPALRAEATGTICIAGSCDRFDEAQAYHDHNWGVWRGVTWEWGSARAGGYSILYGRVQPPDSVAGTQPLFAFVVDSLGFLALFRPHTIRYDDARTIVVDGRRVRVPAAAEMVDVRGDDTLRVELLVEDAAGTDTPPPVAERGETEAERHLARPYFIQMKGRVRVTGRLDGRPVRGEGTGFFETYR